LISPQRHFSNGSPRRRFQTSNRNRFTATVAAVFAFDIEGEDIPNLTRQAEIADRGRNSQKERARGA
jgi:hypothetical protein